MGHSTVAARRHLPGSPGSVHRWAHQRQCYSRDPASLHGQEGHEEEMLGAHLRGSGHFPLDKNPALEWYGKDGEGKDIYYALTMCQALC